ncbi:MAG: N-ATPase subunit AtpR [Thermoleophilia bacterium]
MNAVDYIFLPAVAGISLGTLYFGGLWLTLGRIMTTRNPALFILGSYLGRLSASFLGFYLVARAGQWQGLLVCLAFFILVRTVMVRYWEKPQLISKDKL